MDTRHKKTVLIIGAGPSGLFAAEILAGKGYRVEVYDQKSGAARKFLYAGRGGLNITHSEPLDTFITRYGKSKEWLAPMVRAFSPSDMQNWCASLGESPFTGSSGKIFPRSFKATPLLRAWSARLQEKAVTFHFNHRWCGWAKDKTALFENSEPVAYDAMLLALGGASWPQLGSDGSWVEFLREEKCLVADLEPSNCGFCLAWPDFFSTRFAGHPLKSISLRFEELTVQGEMMIDKNGIEGGVVYALSAPLREQIKQHSSATVFVDLKPSIPLDALAKKLSAPRKRQSFSTWIKKNTGLSGAALGLIEMALEASPSSREEAHMLAQLIKNIPLLLTSSFPLKRAISSAGGVRREAVNEDLMLLNRPCVFVAGEMLDWEAPTGGYLLQGCFSTAFHAANGIDRFLSCPNVPS